MLGKLRPNMRKAGSVGAKYLLEIFILLRRGLGRFDYTDSRSKTAFLVRHICRLGS
jgi:hypothetical protein